ncbi:MAG: hypothetical protein D6715_11180 [Calditrichaeota bacterium]|nr:MAG: hypothetical protein D6715_11180 [Calditrichota bacterium]
MNSPNPTGWKARLAALVVRWKSRQWRESSRQLTFPIPGERVHRVLAVLPGQLENLDRATAFVYRLRQVYPEWKIDLFDPDKIPEQETGFTGLPKKPFLDQLRQEGYELVINLSAGGDLYRNYLVLASGAPYRLALFTDADPFYNITCLVGQDGVDYEKLLGAIQQLFLTSSVQVAN